MTLPRLASRLAEKWALNLEFLRASLEHDPDGPQAWRWEIKARVLTYLLARYGNDPRAGVIRPTPSTEVADVQPLPRNTIAPRPRQVFTERLQRIAEANDVPPEEQSHLAEELNRRLPPTPPSLQEELRLTPFAVFLWLLFGLATGAFVAMAMAAGGLPVALSLGAAIAVWGILSVLLMQT